MTILSDTDIRAALYAKRIVVRPLTEDAIQPSSIDLRLRSEVRFSAIDGRWRTHHLVNDGPIRMYQGAFVLGATLEWIEVPNDLVGVLVGKSSRAREGFAVEAAGYVDPGWRGNLTLELSNRSPEPLWLMPGMLIAQIRFEQLSSPCARPYGSVGLNSRYQDSEGPVASRAVVGGPS